MWDIYCKKIVQFFQIMYPALLMSGLFFSNTNIVTLFLHSIRVFGTE